MSEICSVSCSVFNEGLVNKSSVCHYLDGTQV